MHFAQLVGEHLVVLGCAVCGMVAVPGREVYAEQQAVFLAGGGQFGEYVALAVLPGAFAHGVFAVFAGPEAKAVMVFGGDDDAFHTGELRGTRPLPGIKFGRIEHFGVFVPMPPFLIGKGIRAEVDEHVIFQLLPLHLRIGRQGAVRLDFRLRPGFARGEQ